MSNSSSKNQFTCPKCLAQVEAGNNPAGARISCPQCESSLVVPQGIAADGLFDDLFEEAPPARRPDKSTAQPDRQSKSPARPDSTPKAKPNRQAESKSESKPQPVRKTPRPDPSFEPLDPITAEEPVTEIGFEDAGDPFRYDDSKSLRIEGISEDVTAADSFYFSCPICDSKIHARARQQGEKVKCADCYSTVEVTKPNKPETAPIDAWRQPARMKVSEDEEFRLAEPIKRPDANFNIEAGFGLDKVEQDLLAPKEIDEVEEVATVKQRQQATTRDRGQQPVGNKRAPTGPQPRSKGLEAKAKIAAKAPVVASDDQPVTLRQIMTMGFATDIDLLIRTVVTIVFLTFWYTMSDSIWQTFARADLDGMQKFATLLPTLLGALACLLVAVWFQLITFSVLMRAVANGFKRVEEWVGFAPSEWMGSFAVVAFAGWAALLPGALLGYMAWTVTGWYIFLPVFTAVSAFGLLPVFLISSFYNESVFNIYSIPVVQTMSNPKTSWLGAYQTIAIALGVFLAGVVSTFLPGLFFNFLGATLQVVAITVLAVLLGRHAKSVVAHARGA